MESLVGKKGVSVEDGTLYLCLPAYVQYPVSASPSLYDFIFISILPLYHSFLVVLFSFFKV